MWISEKSLGSTRNKYSQVGGSRSGDFAERTVGRMMLTPTDASGRSDFWHTNRDGVALSELDAIHPVGQRPDWHESVVLFAYDPTEDLAFYCRIGCWPHRESTQEWVYVQTPEGVRFRSLRPDLPMTAESRRPDGFAAGGLSWTLESAAVHIRGQYADLSVDLVYRDFYASTPWKVIGQAEAVPTTKMGHVESSGWIEGQIVIDGKLFVIEQALSHRDHSWGPRDDRFRVARWLVGTTGPSLSYSFISMIDSLGTEVKAGWVVRDGNVDHARAMDSVVFYNPDGITARGGLGRFLLESGEVIDIRVTTKASMITGNHTSHGGAGSYVCSEGISLTEVNGVEGIVCMTIASCSAGVGEEIKVVDPLYSTITPGLSRRPESHSLIDVNELRWGAASSSH